MNQTTFEQFESYLNISQVYGMMTRSDDDDVIVAVLVCYCCFSRRVSLLFRAQTSPKYF